MIILHDIAIAFIGPGTGYHLGFDDIITHLFAVMGVINIKWGGVIKSAFIILVTQYHCLIAGCECSKIITH